MASFTFLEARSNEDPILLTRSADAELEQFTKDARGIYVYEPFATVAPLYSLRPVLRGNKLILFVEN